MTKEINEIFGGGVLLDLNGVDLNRHQLHYSRVKDGNVINCTDEIHSSPEVAGAIFQAITSHLNGVEPLKRKIEAMHYVGQRADRKIAELTVKNTTALEALNLNEQLITKLIENGDEALLALLDDEMKAATNANLKVLTGDAKSIANVWRKDLLVKFTDRCLSEEGDIEEGYMWDLSDVKDEIAKFLDEIGAQDAND